MAKKIIWTETSVKDRFQIYQFWLTNNQSNSYSEKLERLFNESAKLISLFPEIGTKTDFPEIRVKVIRDFKIFYRERIDSIEIIRVWDTRRKPTGLQIELSD